MSYNDRLRAVGLNINTNVGLNIAKKHEDPPLGSGKIKIKYKGKVYRRYKRGFGLYERKARREGRLGPEENFCECGETNGYYHLLGCDCEDCPICKGQLLSCGHGVLFETPGVRCS